MKEARSKHRCGVKKSEGGSVERQLYDLSARKALAGEGRLGVLPQTILKNKHSETRSNGSFACP